MSKEEADQIKDSAAAQAPARAPGWKRWLMIGLRLLVAAAGIGYVVFSLTWSEEIQVKAGTTLSTGFEVTEKTSFPVVEGMIDPAGPPSDLIIEAPDKNGQPTRVVVTKKQQLSNRYRANQGIASMLGNARVAYLIWGFVLMGFIYWDVQWPR